jgi:hypothetical protein
MEIPRTCRQGSRRRKQADSSEGRDSGGGPLPLREPMNHRDALHSNAVVRYLFGEMDCTEMEDYEAHYFDCCTCARQVMICTELLSDLRDAVVSSRTFEELIGKCRFLIRSHASRIV